MAGVCVMVAVLRAHRGDVTCVDVSRARLVSGGGGGDRTLVLWRWKQTSGWSDVNVARDAHKYGVTVARWAASGVVLASAGVDGAVRLWSDTLAPRRQLVAPGAAAVRALEWAGRTRLIAGHDDGALCVWHAPRGELLARVAAHAGALHAVCAPSPHIVLTACTDGVLKLYDVRELCTAGDVAEPIVSQDNVHDLGALCAASSPRGTLAATGGHDGAVRVWRVQSRTLRVLATLTGHTGGVSGVRWCGGGVTLVSVSHDRTARVWTHTTCTHIIHAHTRYITCVTISHDGTYILTGSNDKSVKMWSLGSLSLDDELDPPCVALEHFALGDLEGIEVVHETEEAEMEDEECAGGGAEYVWRDAHAHRGAINCVATLGEWLATASSDGSVRVYRTCGGEVMLEVVHVLRAHEYPAMCAELGAGGELLLTGGLDGRACLWDVQSGVLLRALSAAEGEAAGGGGVRGARLSPTRPTRLLLATDDGTASLWSVASADPRPDHVYSCTAEALTCCAWSRDALVAVAGGAGGELFLLAPPPRACTLHTESDAHDLGVQSCDFASPCEDLEFADNCYLLATAGCDSLIKLWIIDTEQVDGVCVRVCGVRVVRSVVSHGGVVSCVRWCGAMLVSVGADGWARVWRTGGGGGRLVHAGGAHSPGALAAVLLPGDTSSPPLLACGTLTGELALWRVRLDEREDEDEDEGVEVSTEEEEALRRRAHDHNMTGARLLEENIDVILEEFGYEVVCEQDEAGSEQGGALTARRIRNELAWLRCESPPLALCAHAPHSLLCPLSHMLMREPARASDGYTYERHNILDWICTNGPVSPMTSRRLHNARVTLNYRTRDALRLFLRENGHAPDE